MAMIISNDRFCNIVIEFGVMCAKFALQATIQCTIQRPPNAKAQPL